MLSNHKGVAQDGLSRESRPQLARKNAFEMQAIVSLTDMSVHGYEFLYRGTPRPTSAAGWREVDHSVVDYLLGTKAVPSACFVNLSHDSLLAIDDEKLLNVSAKHDVKFEISEAVTQESMFAEVCDKANRLTAMGVKFVIDDFGAGLDGCRRIYSLDKIEAVKVDRDLLIQATKREKAASMLRVQVQHWNDTGMATIAEGVETPELLAFCRIVGFSMVQGYHIDTIQPSLTFVF